MPADPGSRAPRALLAPLWLALVAVAAVTVVAVIAAGGADRRDRIEEVREARFLNIAQTLKVPLEAAISLGLPLDQLPRAQEMLEREYAAEPDALSIEVIDPHGRVLFGTDRSFLGDLVHESWLEMAADAEAGVWRGDEGVVGVALVNGFGATVGHVAVRFSLTSDEDASSFDQPSLLAGLAALAVFAAALAVVLARLYRPLGADLSAARAVLVGQGAPQAASPLARLAAEAVAAAAAERRAMEAALAQARRIDEDA